MHDNRNSNKTLLVLARGRGYTRLATRRLLAQARLQGLCKTRQAAGLRLR